MHAATTAWSVIGPEAGSSVSLVDFDPFDVARMVSELKHSAIHPLVHVAHGGNVAEIGNLRSEGLLKRSPRDAIFDMDDPSSVFYLHDELLALGVRFVAIRGGGFTGDLKPFGQFLKPHRLRNGRSLWSFSRFRSQRADELKLGTWPHGKGVPPAAGLGFQLSDILQRLHWSAPCSGAIVYTHAGHGEFNQASDRLSWSPETVSGLQQLKAAFHPDGEEPRGVAPWVAPSSVILLSSAVASGLRTAARSVGDRIEIAGWHDALLGIDLPDAGRNGTRFLHGQSFFVDDPERASLLASGCPISTLARMPAADEPATITVVDDTVPSPMLLGANCRDVRAEGATVRRAERAQRWDDEIIGIHLASAHSSLEFELPPQTLAMQDAWMIEMRGGDLSGIAIALRDSAGRWYEAGRDGQWPLYGGIAAGHDGWKRFAFRFSHRHGHPCGPPQGSVGAFRIRGGGDLELRCLALLRPAGEIRPVPESHTLGGRVSDAHEAIVRAEALGSASIETPVDERGFFRLTGLARDRLYRVTTVNSGGTAVSPRGAVFAATRDDFDWNMTGTPN